jgi:hypothetical protein
MPQPHHLSCPASFFNSLYHPLPLSSSPPPDPIRPSACHLLA